MVIVVDGVMSIQGDVNNVHKAKDRSHEYFGRRSALGKTRVVFIS